MGRKRRDKEVAEEGEWGDGEVKSDGPNERGESVKNRDKERDRDKDKEEGNGNGNGNGKGRMSYDREVKSSEDEGELAFMNRPWSGRVQRKIEVWAAYVPLPLFPFIPDRHSCFCNV